MEKRYVYLAGAITDHTSDEAINWREDFKKKLHKNIVAISPLRGEGRVADRYEPTDTKSKFRTSQAIAAKNHYDTHNCDLVLAYLPKEYNDRRPSYGTIFELGWATGTNTPTILVTDDHRLTQHPLIQAKVNWVLDDFDDAAEIINTLFDVYVGNE